MRLHLIHRLIDWQNVYLAVCRRKGLIRDNYPTGYYFARTFAMAPDMRRMGPVGEPVHERGWRGVWR